MEPRIFKADPAKVEVFHLLGDDYDFNEDPLDAEGLADELREDCAEDIAHKESGR